MHQRLRRLIERGETVLTEDIALSAQAIRLLSIKDLRLLHEFVNLIPKAEAILKSVLDLRDEGTKS